MIQVLGIEPSLTVGFGSDMSSDGFTGKLYSSVTGLYDEYRTAGTTHCLRGPKWIFRRLGKKLTPIQDMKAQ